MGNDLSSSLLRCKGTEPQKHRGTEAQRRTPSWHRQRYGSGSIRLGQSIAVRILSRCSSRLTHPLPAHGVTVACGTAEATRCSATPPDKDVCNRHECQSLLSPRIHSNGPRTKHPSRTCLLPTAFLTSARELMPPIGRPWGASLGSGHDGRTAAVSCETNTVGLEVNMIVDEGVNV